MHHRERRRDVKDEIDPADLREGLTHAQLKTLAEMEHFSWELRWVRRPMFAEPVPMVFDRGRKRFVVIRPDGTIDEEPDLALRK